MRENDKCLVAGAMLFVAFLSGCAAPSGVTSVSAGGAGRREYHVSPKGDDSNDGSQSKTLKTISAAALKAQPGDVITVHEGVYRERITPPRGGEADSRRIIYQAATGEKVEIKGSEIVKGWARVGNDTWKVTLANDFFKGFNPYSDLIHGDWFNSHRREHHSGAVYLNGTWLTEAPGQDDVMKPAGENPLWYGKVDTNSTTIWAQFKSVNPNEQLVEINARRAVFYPDKPGINYLTIRGFTMRHAATQWAPPTAEQIGLIGTHWSRGWIIEDNVISHSLCVGVALGKYGDEFDNKSADTAEGYVLTIERALKNGWSKDNIGHHIVRNNDISYCEQAGVVGSLGAVFSTITGNTIHEIHMRRMFGGAEMAGIKIHGAIDVEISRNHIFRTVMGIWLDWMAQGTRVTRNLLHDNDHQDIFVEVDHGPFMVDNNILLSGMGLLDMSRGGAYAHNLFAGSTRIQSDGRKTPFLKAHSTEVAGLHNCPSGDSRFYNNLFAGGSGLGVYDGAKLPVFMGGNIFLRGAKPCKSEGAPLVKPDFDAGVKLVEKAGGAYFDVTLDAAWATEQVRKLVTTELLGRAKIPDLPFERPDGTPLNIDTDYFGFPRKLDNPFPGPFESPASGKQTLKLWPVVDKGIAGVR
ncbi:MAG: right-handed parallel beta-helix repeat-containing protein [bacterium]